MRRQLSQEAIDAVMALHANVVAANVPREKKRLIKAGVLALNAEETWFITFCVWFCLYNTRFKAIEDSKYYTVPASATNEATFADFLALIKIYQRRSVSPSREADLVKFLRMCSREMQDVWLLLLSKKFTVGLPIYEVQDSLDLGAIDIYEVYGAVEPLQTSFSALRYPVAISHFRAPDAPLYIFSRGGNHNTFYSLGAGGLVTEKNFLPEDSSWVTTPRFTIVGYLGEEGKRSIFHPIDYFSSIAEYRAYLRGEEVTGLQDRVVKLREYQQYNLLTQTYAGYIGAADSEATLLDEIVKVVTAADPQYLILVDNNTSRTGEAHSVRAQRTVGIIEDYWVDSGEVKGFLVWFNGALTKVLMSFAGKNKALLHNITPMAGKLLSFCYVKLGKYKSYTGMEVLWGQKPWRPKRVRHSTLRVEKCALCGGTDVVHARRGICKGCDGNVHIYFKRYGVGEWIMPSRYMREKRELSAWEPTLLTVVDYHCRGHIVEAREDGCWRFRPEKTKYRTKEAQCA